ncbi:MULTISPECIES: asparagine synthase (glutamine-hydrolyzing) [Anaerolinea]|uniref:asparagine synthase (glutamine-hydrolyzing) n=1 Tax=Anaerolinea thermophila (strain DSM 14523 / JCM 11388 / NBRC 100420 / UNI-1) TaxID=926569 RepID=E8N097_ANATU|nr:MULTISPECIES: asparagine synthase (glutamine-hydrolyzing) [Anaerolinea]BAJ64646.1 asparagine synthase [Anaerolinea thermophila UNI-1]
MCGIVGEFRIQTRGHYFDLDFKKLTAMMSHRGPDDEGIWSDGMYCTLGFRRLSILDLSPMGHQPMLSQDGRYVIVINGEVYNFQEIRAQLEHLGIKFRSSGDTEVVLYALAEWGIEALERFNGMFALGFYDNVDKRLLLARDHAGIKPLYVLKNSCGVVFASQYDQILAHPWGRDLAFSQEGLAQYFRMGYIPAPYAIHQNVFMLEPGSWLEVQADGKERCGKYFEFPLYNRPSLFGSKAYEAVEAAIDSAVRRQMISDVPVGSFLSGGIDSPLVTAKMKAISNHSFKAFTIGVPSDSADESNNASQYAKELGVEHFVYSVTPDDALKLIDEIILSCSEPFADYSIFPTLLVSKFASREVKVILSGDGGDELFWGYPDRFIPVINSAHLFRYPKWIRSLYWHIFKHFSKNSRLWSVQYFNSIGEWYKGKHTHLSEGWACRIFPDLPEWPKNSDLFTYQGFHFDETAQWLRWNEFSGHLTMVLLKVDRASMYNSLEVRVPLLDKEVIETACQVDWRSCLDLRNRIGKIPLRQALSKYVTMQIIPKKGFTVPMAKWLRGPLRDLLEEKLLRLPGLLGLECDKESLSAYLNMHLTGKFDFSWGIWILLSAALWQEKVASKQ